LRFVSRRLYFAKLGRLEPNAQLLKVDYQQHQLIMLWHPLNARRKNCFTTIVSKQPLTNEEVYREPKVIKSVYFPFDLILMYCNQFFIRQWMTLILFEALLVDLCLFRVSPMAVK
jgi:hypothetical protein